MEIRFSIICIALACGLVTLIPRTLPLMVFSKIKLPDWLLIWLSFIPITVMTALLSNDLFITHSKLTLWGNIYGLIAIIPTILVAVIFRSLLASVLIGIICMALLRYFLG